MAIQTAMVRQQVGTYDSGTQDWVISGFGTPDAVIFIIDGATSLDTDVDDAQLGMGWCDGSLNQGCVMWLSTTGVASTTSARVGQDCQARVAEWYDSETNGYRGGSVTNITTDTVTITWGGSSFNPSAVDAVKRPYMTAIFLKGVSAHVGTGTAPSTIASPTTHSGIGFEPEVILFGSGASTVAEYSSRISTQIGMVYNDGASYPQYMSGQGDYGGQASTAVSRIMRNAYVLQHSTNGTTTLSTYTVTDIQNGQFQLTAGSDGYSGRWFNYLALAATDPSDALELFETTLPTTGDYVVSSLSKTPDSVLMLWSGLTSLNSYDNTGDGASLYSMVYMGQDAVFSAGHGIVDNVATSDTYSRASVTDVMLTSDAGASLLFSADPTNMTWDSGGFTIPSADISTHGAAAYMGIGLGFLTSPTSGAKNLLLMGVG